MFLLHFNNRRAFLDKKNKFFSEFYLFFVYVIIYLYI